VRILITNNTLAMRAGSELYVRDLALALLARGHTPIAFSTALGEVAEELRRATVPVVDDLSAVAEPPDVIHGQHHLETMTALLHFPGVPAVFVCHGWAPWAEAAPIFPRIRCYVAVDEPCRDRLVLDHGIPESQVRILLNFVDLERFRPRAPLPPRPRRALVFSNQAGAASSWVDAVASACAGAGVALDVVGLGCGRPTAEPERLLPDYDLVFAKGRAALESIAVGAAVVLCDAPGAGPMVTAAEFTRLRSLNFGLRALRAPIEVEHLAREIARYDPADAAAVSRRLRDTAGLDAAVDSWLAIYDQVRAAHTAATGDPVAELRAAGRYLRWLGPFLKQRMWREVADRAEAAERHAREEHDRAERWRGAADVLREEGNRLGAERDLLREERDRLGADADSLRAAGAAHEGELGRLAEESVRLAAELETVRGSATFRLRDRVLASPLLGTPTRMLARLAKRGGLYR
jgi:hypothetical protein